MKDDKLNYLLELVIDHYIEKWDPIGSKFLFSLEETDYAPSTLRKYLNLLEQDGLLYQPYNSAWRIPTVKWFQDYIEKILGSELWVNNERITFSKDYARNWLRFLVEKLWEKADWVVVWFLRNDEYYFLWINNLLTESLDADREATRQIVKFIEEKSLIWALNDTMIKRWEVNYTFIQCEDKATISCLYVKIEVEWYEWVLAILWPVRVNYKQNLWILKKFLTNSII